MRTKFDDQAVVGMLVKEANFHVRGSDAIVAALEDYRTSMALNKSQFAEVLGIHKAQYTAITNGRRQPSLQTRIRACSLGINAEILLQQARKQ